MSEASSEASGALAAKSAVFVGLARDCSRHLPSVLQNMHDMATLFGAAAFVIAENDSRDGTAEMLRGFGARHRDFHYLNFDGVQKRLPQGTRRLAFLRNKCMSFIRANAKLRASDYVIVMDMDEINVEPIDLGALAKAVRFLEEDESRAGAFGNSRGVYYDMWALRHDRMCPADFWEDQFDYILANEVDDLTAFEQVCEPRLLTIAEDAAPIEVASAFGGLAIYKTRYTMHATYQGFKTKDVVHAGKRHKIKWQVCEHVSFNEEITRRGGRLYILPYLINYSSQGIEFRESFYRSLIFA
jgi:glycosyltransferase involved in cell wall biosynthesis